MRILGIDPGLNTTGYGVIDIKGNSLKTRYNSLCLRTHQEAKDFHDERYEFWTQAPRPISWTWT